MSRLKMYSLILFVGIGMIAQSGNAGDIEFNRSQTIDNGQLPIEMIAVDLDGDGDQDIVSCKRALGTDTVNDVVWYENDGSGNYGPQQLIHDGGTVRFGLTDIHAADVDNDGDQDVLAIRSIETFPSNFNSRVWVFLNQINNPNNAPWKVTAPISYISNRNLPTKTTSGMRSIDTADLNGDGNLDLILAIGPNGCCTNAGFIYWYKGNGSGAFVAAQSYGRGAVVHAAAEYVNQVVTADIDQDGDIDVVSSHSGRSSHPRSTARVMYHLNNGRGGFTSYSVISHPVGVAIGWNSVAVVDYDNDGLLDIVANNRTDFDLVWFKQLQTGASIAFDSKRAINKDVNILKIAPSDLDGDGDVDFLLPSFAMPSALSWLENDQSTGKIHLIEEDGDNRYASAFAADLDGDGDQDIVTGKRDSNEIGVFLNGPSGPENAPPVADAGTYPIQEANTLGGTLVTLDGSGSSDPDGDLLSYTWSIPTGAATGINPEVFIPLGIQSISLTVSDGEYSANDNSLISVVDTTDPSITAPVDISAEATGLLTEIAIGNADASDVAGTVTLTNDAPISYPLGSTTVTWTANDGNGNSATDTQNMTVVDTTPPAITAPDDITIEATGSLTEVAIGSANASDLAGTVTLTNDAPSSYPLGSTLVTWTADDGKGNSATDAQIITVVDTTPPTIDGISVDNATLWPPNNKMVPVTVSLSATDSVNPNVTCQIIGITVTDEGGNTAGDAEFVPGTLSANLRAERSGSGIGRVYTIEVECSDGSNSTNAIIDVVVPHDQGNGNGKNGNGSGNGKGKK